MSTSQDFLMSAAREHVDSAPPKRSTLVDMLTSRSLSFPDRLAFRFLEDDQLSSTVSYHELDQSARSYAAALQQRFERGSSSRPERWS